MTVWASSQQTRRMLDHGSCEQDERCDSLSLEEADRMNGFPAFRRYVGIDYSGAETPNSSLKGLQVYVATPSNLPCEVKPPPSPRKYWTRRGIAEWLAALAVEDGPSLIGIDHGFSFPIAYFREHDVPLNWPTFLGDFQLHWPTDGDGVYVQFVRDGVCGAATGRSGNRRWRRITEIRARAKSVFHFDVQGSVAKSTHAGLPWLRYLRQRVPGKVHFWPFDGWTVPGGKTLIAEVYPSLWRSGFPRENRNGDQHDAYSVAAWLRRADGDGSLSAFLEPGLGRIEREAAEIEGWILGVA